MAQSLSDPATRAFVVSLLATGLAAALIALKAIRLALAGPKSHKSGRDL